MKFKCCAVCGSTFFMGYDKDCAICYSKKEVPLYERTQQEKSMGYTTRPIYHYSEHDIEYYESLSEQKYNTKDRWYDIFTEEELSKLPTFNIDKYQIALKRENNYFRLRRESGGSDINRKAFLLRIEGETELHRQSRLTQPKCPTCGSTNINKISDLRKGVHALAFGLFSKTARSQFECRDCGYKW